MTRDQVFARDGLSLRLLWGDLSRGGADGGSRAASRARRRPIRWELSDGVQGLQHAQGASQARGIPAAEPAARKHFFALATAVWPRHLRAVEEQLARTHALRAPRSAPR